MAKLYVVGIGPGGRDHFTKKMIDAIRNSEIIVGYTPYIEYLGDLTEGKEVFSTGMKSEIERCNKAIELVNLGKTVSIVSTGDAGLYGMAGPIFELSEDIDIEVVPGISANFAAASRLGAPIMHDNCTISLSDLLTPYDIIMKRVEAAAQGDFVISFYNPRSKGRKDHLQHAIEIISKYQSGDTPVGIVKNAGRQGENIVITRLDSIDYNIVDMLSCVIVGNSKTYIKDNKIVTPRGYENK